MEQLAVHKKRLLRLMRELLLLVPNRRLSAQRTPTGRKPRPTKPHEWWGIEMTTVLVEGVGWIDIVVVLDWYTKTIVGHDAGLRCTAQHGLLVLDMAVNRQFPQGARGQGLSLMRDNGYQPTATTFRQACSFLEIQQAFTSSNNPQGNADTARIMHMLKEACLWPHEWTCPFTLASTREMWINDDHKRYLHSALYDKSPRQFERAYHTSHSTQLAVA